MARVPEQIVPGVYRVDAVRFPYIISVLLIRVNDGWALVDTGGNSLRVQEALAALGAGPDELKHIYLTHHHGEHVSGLPSLRWWAPHAKIVTSRHEARILSGRRRPDPVSNPLFRPLAVRGLPRVSVDHEVEEGDRFAGFRVIATPGHSRGHTSLLSERYGLLVAGDAFGNLGDAFGNPIGLGLQVGVNKAICADPREAKRSAKKLLEEEFTTVVFTHGEPLRENAKQRLREAVERCDYDA
jgi:glyoxylase-like metal-dependent hydrolase (beta-lactamase superfamily II)